MKEWVLIVVSLIVGGLAVLCHISTFVSIIVYVLGLLKVIEAISIITPLKFLGGSVILAFLSAVLFLKFQDYD